MGTKRIVDTDFWTDGLVIDYFSPEDKYFMLYLLTNPHSRQSGIYKLPRRVMSFETGYTLDTINILIDRFQNTYKKIIYCAKTQEVAVLNYLKYSIVKGGKPVNDCITKDLHCVSEVKLISETYKHIEQFLKTSSKPSIQQICEIFEPYVDHNAYEDISFNDNDNDNDNDNEESSTYRGRIVKTHEHQGFEEKQKKSKKSKNQVDAEFKDNSANMIVNDKINKNKGKIQEKKSTPIKQNYAEFVTMKDAEYQKLIEKHGADATKAMIEKLNVFKGANGKKYKSDYMAILNWVVDWYSQGKVKSIKSETYEEKKQRILKEIEEEDKLFDK